MKEDRDSLWTSSLSWNVIILMIAVRFRQCSSSSWSYGVLVHVVGCENMLDFSIVLSNLNTTHFRVEQTLEVLISQLYFSIQFEFLCSLIICFKCIKHMQNHFINCRFPNASFFLYAISIDYGLWNEKMFCKDYKLGRFLGGFFSRVLHVCFCKKWVVLAVIMNYAWW